jgi:hypothetical protein
MRFYIIYEKYTDLGLFEGQWETRYGEFETLNEAESEISWMKKNADWRNIIGPLFLARSLDKTDKTGSL